MVTKGYVYTESLWLQVSILFSVGDVAFLILIHSFPPSHHHYVSMYALASHIAISSNYYLFITNVSQAVWVQTCLLSYPENIMANLFSLFLDIVFSVSLFFSFLLFSCTDGLQLITYQSSIPITSQMTPLYICAIFTLSA